MPNSKGAEDGVSDSTTAESHGDESPIYEKEDSVRVGGNPKQTQAMAEVESIFGRACENYLLLIQDREVDHIYKS